MFRRGLSEGVSCRGIASVASFWQGTQKNVFGADRGGWKDSLPQDSLPQGSAVRPWLSSRPPSRARGRMILDQASQ